MGVISNSGVVLTEKDLNSIGFSFPAKPTFGFHHDHDECGNCETAARSGDGMFGKKEKEVEREEKEEEEDEEDKCKVAAAPLMGELKISSLRVEFKLEEEDEDDGFKTPTSSVHRIPSIPPCPPAPKKPKSLPSTKRRAPAVAPVPNRRVLLDLSNEIQSLFPSHLGGKSKRVRRQQAGK